MSRFLLLSLTLAAFAAGSPGAARAQEKRIEAYGTKLLHRDGSRTETQKMGDSMQIRQETFDKNNVLIQIRVFQLDTLGRHRQGIIWDGRKNPLASIDYIYNESTGKMSEERMHNVKGKVIRRLFYPGAFPNDPRYANRIVAFNFDPERPDDKGTEVKGEVKPIAPLKSAEDEFDPSIPGATALPSASAAAAPAPGEKPKRRFGLFQKKDK